MKFTDRTRRVLAYRRHAREMARAGWEYVGEGGGHLWQLVRGSRRGQRREELGIKTEHMDALVEVQRLGAPDSGSNA